MEPRLRVMWNSCANKRLARQATLWEVQTATSIRFLREQSRVTGSRSTSQGAEFRRRMDFEDQQRQLFRVTF